MRKYIAVTLAFAFVFASCGKQNVDFVDDSITSIFPTEDSERSVVDEKKSEIIGDFQYPENPSEALKNAIKSDIDERGLLMEISDVERFVFENKKCAQIKIAFSGGSDNMCVITFINEHLNYGYDESLDGKENPSFTIAFKYSDNSQDMITVLTSVIKYLSPDLRLDDAQRIAINQDKTISTDGYSMPQDMNGYQIQTRYTNPHISIRVPDFESKLWIEVTALTQMMGKLDTQNCKELKTIQDFDSLKAQYWENDNLLQIVYGDFIVKNVWQRLSYLHGETWEVVEVESMAGEQYFLSLDNMRPYVYELGTGQKYTLYINPKLNNRIRYAIQRSELVQYNSRGQPQPIDYPTDDWQNPLVRLEHLIVVNGLLPSCSRILEYRYSYLYNY